MSLLPTGDGDEAPLAIMIWFHEYSLLHESI